MELLGRKASIGLLAAGVAVAVLSASGVALASHHPGHVSLSGGGVLSERIQTDTVVANTNSVTYQTLGGTGVTFSVSSGTTRLFDAQFAAESDCFGGGTTGSCFVRVVVQNLSSGSIVQLHPRGEFRFDSAGSGDDFQEGLGIVRSIRLGHGSYKFFVQRRTSDPAISLFLRGWHFSVQKQT